MIITEDITKLRKKITQELELLGKQHEEITEKLVLKIQEINEIIMSKFKNPKNDIIKFPLNLKNVTLHQIQGEMSHLIVENNETGNFSMIVIYAYRDFSEECRVTEVGFTEPLLTKPYQNEEGQIVFRYWRYTDHYFMLKCIPKPLKKKYIELRKSLKQSEVEVKSRKEWLKSANCVGKLQQKFSGDE